MATMYKKYILLSAAWFIVWYLIAACLYGHVSSISTLGIHKISVVPYAIAVIGSVVVLWLASSKLATQDRTKPLSKLVRMLAVLSSLVVCAPYSINAYFFWVHVGLAVSAATVGFAISATVARLTGDKRVYLLIALQIFGLCMVFYTWPMGPSDVLWRLQFAYELAGILPVFIVLYMAARLIKES